jgi:serine/threonine protein kinase
LALTPGTRLGVYEVTAQIGEGGMGQVYRARDTKLDRDVAIKILPEAFAHDADRVARFQREAKTLASLNHPNIAIIHGLEQAGDVHALVMELVEGEDLSQRIARGAIPLDEALPIAKQIAEALEAAHEQQIIHRDLKPANVKVREDGTVKVLDFGLAKAMDPAGAASPHVSRSPTITTPAMTQAGLILGTAAYMSPEQASGRPVDKRADIWSFGVVLWEMLTGRRLFAGETVSHTLADVLRAEIDFAKLPTNTPTAIRRLLRRCLERDAKTRLRDIGEARVVIANPGQESEPPTVLVRRSRALPWALAATAALAIVAAALGVVAYLPRTPLSQAVQKFSVLPPANATIDRISLELAPDGHAVAFIATSAEGHRLLWVRSFDARSARPLQGTDDAQSPFWSPDSRSLGFFAQKKLKRIQTAGGPPQTIGDAAGPGLGGTWNRDNVIVFAPDNGAVLYRVSANGGTRSPATKLDPTRRETAHFSPTFLPDGRHFLFFAVGQTRGINIGALESTTSEHLIDADSRALYAPAISVAGGTAIGHLVYVRDSTLLAQPFNAERRQITGDAVPIADGEFQAARIGAGAPFSIAETGVLAYRSLSEDVLLAWFDRAGRRLGTLGGSDRYNAVEIASDSKRVAVERIDPRSRAIDIWLLDVDGGRSSQFTFNGGSRPRWSSDGRFLSYDRSGVVFRKPADNSGAEEMLYQAPAGTAFAGA